MRRRVFYVRFPNKQKTDGGRKYRPSKPHQGRDEVAITLMHDCVRQPGDIIEPLLDVEHADLSFECARREMRAGDLIITATRPGLDDGKRDRLTVEITDCWLMGQMKARWRRYLRMCKRREVVLTDEGARALHPDFADRRDLSFCITEDAKYDRKGPVRTAGYVFYAQELWSGGPSWLSMFGLSGPTTLGLAYALNHFSPSTLRFGADGFRFLEVSAGQQQGLVPAVTPARPRYASRWTIEVHDGGARSIALPLARAASA